MLAWLFGRKIFSPTISDPFTFYEKKTNKKKQNKKKQQKKNKQTNKQTNKKKKKKKLLFIKKWILKGIPVEKLAMQNFIFTANIKYKFTYTTFLTAEDKQIWQNFINILLCSKIIIK